MSSPEIDAPSTDGANRLGQVISGRYRIIKLLGEGGMGAVYLAEHTAMKKLVALKLLHAEMSENPEVIARFEREGVAVARVEHPNVASATDFGKTDDGVLFLVLEYVEGTALREALAGAALTCPRALHITRQVASALERAHDAGVVHRDLKPENVMLVEKDGDPDFVKVLDFGIAKVAAHAIPEGSTQPLTRLGTILGTPEYMAPEQALAEPVTPQSDFYALGIMLYEMLAGKHPFSPPDRVAMLSFHIVAPVPAIADRAPEVEDVPPPVEALVRQLLEKDSKKRPSSARQLIELLDRAAAESGIQLRGSQISLPRGGLAQLAPPSGPLPDWKPADGLAKTAYGEPSATIETPPPDARTSVSQTIRRQPRWILLVLVAALPIGFALVILAFVVARRNPTVPIASEAAVEEPASKRAPEAKVTAAEAEGPDALAALVAEFPEDIPLKKKTARAYATANKNLEAVRAVRALVIADPKAADDPEVVQIVQAGAQDPLAADAAFAMLEGALGARGADVLYELSTKGTPPSVRARAQRTIGEQSVRAHASPELAILLDMTAAKSCKDKHELLERVKEHGDARLAPMMKRLKDRGGCGVFRRSDCWGCMRRDDALEDATQAIESRSTSAPK